MNRCPYCHKPAAKAGDQIAPHYDPPHRLCLGSYLAWHTTYEDIT